MEGFRGYKATAAEKDGAPGMGMASRIDDRDAADTHRLGIVFTRHMPRLTSPERQRQDRV